MGNESQNDSIMQMISSILDQMLLGKVGDSPEFETDDELVAAVLEKISKLGDDIKEMNDFAFRIAKGQLDGPTPNRRNYLSAYLKELHSQLTSLTWKAKLLKSGQMVSKLDYTGELFEAFNGLVEKVAEVSTHESEEEKNDKSGWEWSVNSWRYHQILSALNHLHIMVLEVDSSGKVVYANLPAKENLGAITNLKPESLPDNPNVLLTSLALNSTENNNFPIFQEVYDNSDGSWYKINSDRVLFPDGQMGYLHMVDDISEWKKHESQLRRSATVDPLTGAYNRRAGLQALENLLTHTKASEEHCAAFIDVDNLKKINDGHGHKEGDYAIVNIASTLMSSVRDSDTVSRYGGDEFLVVFKSCSREAAERIMSRMDSKIKHLNETNDKPYTLAFSRGLIQFHPDPNKKVMDLIEEMDEKMYHNKQEKKRRAKAEAAAHRQP